MSSKKKLITPIPLLEFNPPKQINVGMLGWGRRNGTESHLWASWLASKFLWSMRKASLLSTAEIPEENGSRCLQSKGRGPERKPVPEDSDRSDYAEDRGSSLLSHNSYEPFIPPGQQGLGSNIGKCVIGLSDLAVSRRMRGQTCPVLPPILQGLQESPTEAKRTTRPCHLQWTNTPFLWNECQPNANV